MRKKEQINIIIKHLNNYKIYLIGIKNIQQSLDEILTDKHSGYLKDQLNIYKTIIISIDEAMRILSEDERKFIRLRYIEELSMSETAKRIGCSVQNGFRIRNNAMNKLLISLRNLLKIPPDLSE